MVVLLSPPTSAQAVGVKKVRVRKKIYCQQKMGAVFTRALCGQGWTRKEKKDVAGRVSV